MTAAETVDPAFLAANPLPDPGAESDKNSRGRVLVLAGPDVPGAALLAGEAALRAGAGKLQIAARADHVTALAIAAPEARVMALPSGGGPQGAVRESLLHSDAVVLGPGWIDEAAAAAAALGVLGSGYDRALVLDAAALTALRHRPGEVQACPAPTVLTPHAGEMARLLDRDADAVTAEPEATVREAARRFGAVALLKGAVTLIAAPDGRLLRHDDGVVGLATSGSGDVLAGVLGGLLARGAEPLIAAAWAVWLHGAAGRRLSETVGPLGFLARELPPLVPGLMTR